MRLKLAGWVPYAEVGSAVVWTAAGQCSVWCWDAAQARTASQSGGERAIVFATTLPESLLHSPHPEGLRLVQCLEGYEGQLWRGSLLTASRWWPNHPSDDDWLAFLRGASVGASEQGPAPAAEALPLQPHPWAAVAQLGTASDQLSAWEPWTRWALVLLAGTPAVVMAAREVQLHRESASLERRLVELRGEAAPMLRARALAHAANERVRVINDSARYPSPLTLMSAVAESLPSEGVQLREWNMADGTLRFQFATSGVPVGGAELVAALERTGLFHEVRVVPAADPQQLGLGMRLRSLREFESRGTPGRTSK